MTTIESKKVIANASREEIFQQLSDLNNFKNYLPEDKISDWQSTSESCSFKVQNAYKIGLDLKEASPNHNILLSSAEGSPFPFTLNIHLDEKEGKTEAYQICEAKLNPFLKMMVVGPLQNLFDHIADKLAAQYP